MVSNVKGWVDIRLKKTPLFALGGGVSVKFPEKSAAS